MFLCQSTARFVLYIFGFEGKFIGWCVCSVINENGNGDLLTPATFEAICGRIFVEIKFYLIHLNRTGQELSIGLCLNEIIEFQSF